MLQRWNSRCKSLQFPGHGPTTFACTHYQELLHQLFTQILSVESALPSSGTEFLSNITTALSTLDKGLHIGAWGEVKEWKLPDSWGYDFENDTHRHLSNLTGCYPGYSVSPTSPGIPTRLSSPLLPPRYISTGPGTSQMPILAGRNSGGVLVGRC
jgi:alpha-L-fucosidase 2